MPWVNYPFKLEKQYRLQDWDYSRSGYYFVTICTKDRINYFGNIPDGKMQIYEIGKINYGYWLQIP